jgi:hypothetical protein
MIASTLLLVMLQMLASTGSATTMETGAAATKQQRHRNLQRARQSRESQQQQISQQQLFQISEQQLHRQTVVTTTRNEAEAGGDASWLSVPMPAKSHYAGLEVPTDSARWKRACERASTGTLIHLDILVA